MTPVRSGKTKDFMFELTSEEVDNLRCHFGTSSWGGARYSPLAFIEQGVAMLSPGRNRERAPSLSCLQPQVERTRNNPLTSNAPEVPRLQPCMFSIKPLRSPRDRIDET
jgi:hypothetical protein